MICRRCRVAPRSSSISERSDVTIAQTRRTADSATVASIGPTAFETPAAIGQIVSQRLFPSPLSRTLRVAAPSSAVCRATPQRRTRPGRSGEPRAEEHDCAKPTSAARHDQRRSMPRCRRPGQRATLPLSVSPPPTTFPRQPHQGSGPLLQAHWPSTVHVDVPKPAPL